MIRSEQVTQTVSQANGKSVAQEYAERIENFSQQYLSSPLCNKVNADGTRMPKISAEQQLALTTQAASWCY